MRINLKESLIQGVREPKKLMLYCLMLCKYKLGNKPYRTFFQEMMKLRAAKDPRAAIGGMWKKIGKLQFNFLLEQGLQPCHSVLDLGCGSLRGGIHFVRHLEDGKYWGIDISKEILEAAWDVLENESLLSKRPTLRLTDNLEFREVREQTFDYIVAHSVFTHMPMKDVTELLMNVSQVMKTNTLFFATFLDGGERSYTADHLNFYQSFVELRKIAGNANLNMEIMQYAHPRGQKMLRISRGAREAAQAA
jgi:cyclopropane fatty-acyl-phospholipid synthase-like methyltransferase